MKNAELIQLLFQGIDLWKSIVDKVITLAA